MFKSLLVKVASALEGAGIPYMVIGGQAVLLYGEPRLTRDIDITLGVDASEIVKVLNLSKGIGLSATMSDVETFARKTNMLPVYDKQMFLT